MDYRRSARLDLRVWMMLLVGLGFALAGFTVAPADNCGPDGDCAPWLVPVAKWIGVFLSFFAVVQLWVNPRRGSMFDPDTGDLVWWQAKARGHEKGGRIHPSQISRIRIERREDNPDEVHLYDLDGNRQAYFDSEVVPWRVELWAQKLVAAHPHIRLEQV